MTHMTIAQRKQQPTMGDFIYRLELATIQDKTQLNASQTYLHQYDGGVVSLSLIFHFLCNNQAAMVIMSMTIIMITAIAITRHPSVQYNLIQSVMGSVFILSSVLKFPLPFSSSSLYLKIILILQVQLATIVCELKLPGNLHFIISSGTCFGGFIG